MQKRKLKIAVVGAGPTGLCCTRHALDYGHDVTVFEQNSKVGGLWDYKDRGGSGSPIHSRIYQGLLTNAPTEVMGFLSFPFPRTDRSFVGHKEVLAFLESYAINFNLKPVIKFENQVVNVRPLQGRWEILSMDLKNSVYEKNEFDAMFLCNGHYSAPIIPHYVGLDEFSGHKMHSMDYRGPDRYQDEICLVIGAGNSGRDIAFQVATKAKRVIWSNHSKYYDFSSSSSKFPLNLKKVEDVKRFTMNSVQLVNGDEEEISCVLFCTGYKYSFPFLSVDCGLNLKGRLHMEPLYKEVINVNHPTMAVIGLSVCIFTFLRHDLQALLCLKYWNGEIELPSKEKMLAELRIENERRSVIGFATRSCHLLIENMMDYMNEIGEICKMNIVPKVFHEIAVDLFQLITKNPSTFREFNYTILNDEIFERKHISE